MDLTQKGVEELVTELGGTNVKSITKNCSHLITIRAEAMIINRSGLCTGKVSRAFHQKVHVISEDWLLEVKKQQTRVAENEYLWSYIFDQEKKQAAANAANGTNGSTSGTKRPANGTTNGTADKKAKVKKTKTENGVKEEKETVAEGQFVKKKDAIIPLDSFCDQVDHLVYIDPDSGMIYDASLNQSNASNNNNKFYLLQLLHHPKNKTFKTWTRWGRVGEGGQKALLGDGSFADAVKHFEKKFKDKSGLRWEDRTENPKPGKYAFIERSYESDSDEESDDEDAAMKGENGDVKMEDDEETKVPKCTLAKPVESLMDMIFNDSFFQATMTALNYDANKLPLGKLSKATILRGFAQLKELAAIINDPDTAATDYGPNLASTMEQLSNTYYSLIPHDFGRNRPPIIRDQISLKKEVELLESLSDMKVAADLMKVDRKAPTSIHPADRRFNGLNLDELTPLKPTSKEYKLLSSYLCGTVGSTHSYNYDIIDIFRVQRQGEAMRFNTSKFADIPSDRRLLWHGSRCTNFGGILSQGLRIAPPEAPVSGYMFGKGIYLADISSKSAGYCSSYCSNNEGLLLLCEAELGNPIQELRNSSYNAGESAKAAGMYSTKGMGSMAPKKWMDAGAVNKNLKGVQMVSLPCTEFPRMTDMLT